jgi:hypothetical protein
MAAGLLVQAAGYYLALRLAYGQLQGPVAASSYLADDLASLPRRVVATVLVAATVWSLVHYYGLRGPLAALAFATAASFVGYQTLVRDVGPLGHLDQYLAYAVPSVIALMLTWRIAYRRVAI